MLAVPARVPDMAREAAGVITACGGYEVTYFRGWWIEYLSPAENLAHQAPTQSPPACEQ